MAVQIQVRRDTEANWTSEDPTLAAGEIGFESDTYKFKIGDGSTEWTALSYFASGSSATLSIKETGNNSYTILDNDGYDVVLCGNTSFNITITLPTAADNSGRRIFIKKTDTGAGAVTIDGEGSETIDGSTTWSLPGGQQDSVCVLCNGTAWYII
jgi:hypothetical protein